MGNAPRLLGGLKWSSQQPSEGRLRWTGGSDGGIGLDRSL